MDNRSTQQQQAELIKDYLSGQVPDIGRRARRGCLTKLFSLLLVGILGGALLYGVVAITGPWAFHIGGRWTPLLTWHGYGELLTKNGSEYPLYINFYPSSHFSQLHLEGLRPTGGLQGRGWLCTSPGVTQPLTLTGTVYGGWRSTEDSLMAFRLVEPVVFNVGQRQGFFDLAGRWKGPRLAMTGKGVPDTFRSGLRIEGTSVAFDWGSYSEFKAACAKSRH
ncbi:MAG: hypothetical protein ACHQJX_04020 [Candidatus Acidiferrales bacterium]|nr:hypothetical protein [Terracidiphilus sp.]